MWIDIPLAQAFGTCLPPANKPKARRLKTSDPRVVAKYLKNYKAFVKTHNLLDRAFNLQASCRAGAPLSEEQVTEFEKIDELRVQGMKMAERKCRKLKMGNVPWSPKIGQASLQIHVWKMIIK